MAITPDVYLSMGLRESEYERIVSLLGREPTHTELGMYAVMWSEHCGYKFSRPVLAYFKKYKEAIQGKGLENAGLIDLGDGLAIAMKVESHNHPSAVEPYQGAATGVGGIIRDIFTMGARPIASLNSLRFGPIREGEDDPEVVARNRYIFEGVVAGIAGYGNCVGVPTVAGEIVFHKRYSGNPLVNAMAVGLVETEKIASAAASGLGNPVIYLGSATGRDGIHGATFASEELGEDSEAKRPNVQIGDPFAEKSLIEATLEALATGAIVAIQDMGAAGLTCSTVEMSSLGGVGMEVDLDKVPMREPDMSGYELMLSESQERMLCVAEKGREQEVVDVFDKWGLSAVVIGRVVDTGNVKVTRSGETICDAPAVHFTDECPAYRTEIEEPPYYQAAKDFSLDNFADIEHELALHKLLSSTTLASKRWAYGQYDQQVQTQTVKLPGQADAAVLAPRGTDKGVALKIDGNGRWVFFDPYVGGQLAVAEAARNVACTGARPAGVTDGLNFGNPEDPHVYWQFERAVKGIADAAEALGTPVVSGNVSFYNESQRGEVLPTPLIGMLGILNSASDAVGSQLPEGKGKLVLVHYDCDAGPQKGLGASAYLAAVHGVENGVPVPADMPKEKELCEFLAKSAEAGAVQAMHDVSDGGIALALAEMAIANRVGVTVDLPKAFNAGIDRRDAALFGELPGKVILACAAGQVSRLADRVPASLSLTELGDFDDQNSELVLAVQGREVVRMPVDEAASIYEAAIPAVMEPAKP